MITVLLYVRLNRVEFQQTPFLGRKFVDKSGKIKQEILQRWTQADEPTYYKAIQQEYIWCLIQAEDVIKSRQLTRAIRLFCAAIIIILPAIGFPVLAKFLTV